MLTLLRWRADYSLIVFVIYHNGKRLVKHNSGGGEKFSAYPGCHAAGESPELPASWPVVCWATRLL